MSEIRLFAFLQHEQDAALLVEGGRWPCKSAQVHLQILTVVRRLLDGGPGRHISFLLVKCLMFPSTPSSSLSAQVGKSIIDCVATS